jgi:AcrR family transcriptional regulator
MQNHLILLMNEYSFITMNRYSSMPKSKSDPIQEQLIQARRIQILDAATIVFAEKGFQRATIRDVASAAGIADGTIYIYFENKTALLLGILDRLNESERRDDDLAQAPEMDLRSFLRAYFKQRMDVFSGQGSAIFQVILSEVLVNPELRTLYVERIIAPTYALAEPYFEQLAAQGKVRKLDSALTLRILAATFLGLLVQRVIGDEQLQTHWDELPDLLTTILLDGLEPEE